MDYVLDACAYAIGCKPVFDLVALLDAGAIIVQHCVKRQVGLCIFTSALAYAVLFVPQRGQNIMKGRLVEPHMPWHQRSTQWE